MELSNFSVVFVITTEEAAKDNGERYEMYKRATFQLTAALKHEQLRCRYLTNEVEAMIGVRERWLYKQCNIGKGEAPPSASPPYKNLDSDLDQITPNSPMTF